MSAVLHSLRLATRDFVTGLLNSRLFPRVLRSRAWAAIGHRVASSALINPDCFLGRTTGLTIGGKTFINYGCFFDLAAPTIIGERCDVGYEVMFVTSTHALGDSRRRAGEVEPRPISVGDGVWIGARATILPGVTVGDGAVIAAGAVVTTDCEGHSLYAGVPARKIRALEI